MTLFKLGVQNIKHNFRSYFSYFISTLFSVFMLFMFYSIYYNKQMEAFSNGRVKVYTIFKAASIVVIIFSALFIWYANSFFIKSRKKEMALYSILGMKKKEIGTLLFCENMFLGILSIIIGLPLGVIASKFLLQLLVNIMKVRVVVQYTVESRAVIATTLIFIALFLFNSIKAYGVIYKFRLIELLSAEKEAEKAPEGSKIMALLSVIMIFSGYFIAYTKLLQGGSKMMYFGLLVLILVVSGTYILFNNFIVILFNRLKKNKKLYYKGENLISISQILYRIKANSNLLSTIAVISAVAITAISFTFSTYMSLEQVPTFNSPFSLMYTGGDETLNNKVEKIINKHSETKVTYRSDIVMINGKGLTSKYKGPYGKDLKAPFDVYIISRSEYNEILNNSELNKAIDGLEIVKDLKFTKDNQCFFIEVSNDAKRGRLKGEKVKVETNGNSSDLDIIDSDTKGVVGASLQKTTLVVADSAFNKLLNTNKENTTVIRGYTLDNSLNSGKLVSELSHVIPEDKYFNSFYGAYTNTYKLMGSYVFIGMFLGILFVLSTGSILYYKQLTEAYADKGRYNILRKIGAGKKETRNTVVKQLALIYGLPLLVGIFHSAAALCVYIKYMDVTKAVVEGVLAMAAVYTVIYLCYYALSVKAYMKIVSSK
ncbi:permease [Clostridium pasteurianum DSM 525 = ATCC 6013]|uniref:Permease n=1 Tax=Clostridium pasteurianum DSM 525 = ATCC 6013 TaxID=1262449 RepID=A0A0H3J7K3_CLOPA|nr:ABC transporter permease [Clostridium pasteurianum]AJA49896.1 permease [Clostridium pasteurianum DSM 525 = ATCC 6013]AJA53884.1 permease [Clostridium pasteurianum DSM 525 = ATCC 6013]AOZ77035.1 permease [Clostridium pasteurianum DSM 525 = ATCC 6013]AOZ80832.1 permease [Clostridium pasteurianum]ELP57854.1 permease [Clostridium pasteurianum DSM 525 = ATCC 6013]